MKQCGCHTAVCKKSLGKPTSKAILLDDSRYLRDNPERGIWLERAAESCTLRISGFGRYELAVRFEVGKRLR
jgi:hypothetical protein